MSQTIKIGLIGAGFAAQGHAFGYRNASMDDRLNDVDVVLETVADPNQDLARHVQGKYGFTSIASDYQEILDNPEISAVSIALPNDMYRKVVADVIAAGKHVFCEKPLGLNAAEAKELAKLAEDAGVITSVGFCRRRVPALAAMAELVADGRLGTIRTFHARYYADYASDPNQPRTWRYVQDQSGGGAVADIGAHVIDGVKFVLGPIAAVTDAQLDTVIKDRPMPAGGTGHNQKISETERGEVTNDDTAIVTMRTAGGAVGTVSLSRIATGVPDDFMIEVHGDKGWARFHSMSADLLDVYETGQAEAGFDGARTIVAGPAFPYFNATATMPGRGVGTGYGEYLLAEIQEFVAAVSGDGTTTVPFAEAVHTMEVIGAAQQAAVEHRSVTIA